MNVHEDKLISKTILEEKEYKIPAFKSLSVGDPMYFEQGTKNLTLDVNLPAYANRKAGIILQRINYQWKTTEFKEPLVYDTVVAIVYNISPNGEKYVEALRDGSYYSDVQVHKELGCDSAQFDILVNDTDWENFQTGADGFYGDFYKYPHNRAYILKLELDPDYIGLERIKQKLGHVFDCKELSCEKSSKDIVER